MKFIQLALGRTVPSVSLDKYLIRLFLVSFFSVLCLLVVVLQTLSLLNKSDEILAAPGATDWALLHYVSLQAPQYLNQLVPFSSLIAVLATLAGLANRNEITVMRGEGVSPYQIVFPLEIGALLIVVGHFALQELVVVNATHHLAAWADSSFETYAPPTPDSRRHVWLWKDRMIVKAERATLIDSRGVLDEVTLYEYGPNNLISHITYVDFAWYEDHNWMLFGVRNLNVEDQMISSLPSELLGADIPPSRFMAAAVHPDETSLSGLRRAILERRTEGTSTWSLETSFLHRFIAPAATLLMPLISAMVGFGVPRLGGVWGRVAIGGLLGFSYFVADSLTLAMGTAGTLPPLLAVFAPFTVFALVGIGMLIRLAS